MSLADSLKNVGKAALGTIWESDTPEQSKPTPSVVSPSIATPVKSGAAASTTSLLVDPEMLAILNKTITDRRSSYTTFLEADEKLKPIVTDETQRLKAAAAMCPGATKVTLSQAIDAHLADIDGVKMRFNKATEAQLAQKSGGLRDQAKQLQVAINDRSDQIEEMRRQITELEARTAADTNQIAELSVQADAAEAEIKATSQRFEATLASVQQSLTLQKSRFATLFN